MAINMLEDSLFLDVQKLIIQLRRGNDIENNWGKFRQIVTENSEEICLKFNTRWLISICDTFADYGDEIEKRNALLISVIGDMEKLFASRLLLFDIQFNEVKYDKLKKAKAQPLWDGMTSFNIQKGDMTNNLFKRVRNMLKATPVISEIFETVLSRITHNDTFLADLNRYHKNLLSNPPRNTFMKRNTRRFKKFTIGLMVAVYRGIAKNYKG